VKGVIQMPFVLMFSRCCVHLSQINSYSYSANSCRVLLHEINYI